VNEKYHLTEVVLGTGNFATVKLAFHPQTGEKYAVKIINKQKFIQKPKFHEHLVTEITILKKLNHVTGSPPEMHRPSSQLFFIIFIFPPYLYQPGIVRIQDVIDSNKNVYIFLEL